MRSPQEGRPTLFKGAAANVGGQELSNAARRAENLGATGDLKSVVAILAELEKEFERLRPELVAFCE
jgi:HPt (histidine-containing phosphotransfer) domain-containing protein